MNESSHETWNTRFRKRVKAISALATIVGNVVFRPPPGTQFVLAQAFVKITTVTGPVVTDAPNIKLTNGVGDVVAAVDLLTTLGVVQRMTPAASVGGNTIIDNAHPLTLVSADAVNGPTVFNYDLIVFLDKISN